MATYVKLSDPLKLELQLGDGAKFPTTRVFAKISKIDGTPIVAEFELTNNGDGNYTDENNVMSSDLAVKVTYFIRKADGTSSESKYNPFYLTEIFLRNLTAELIEKNLDTKVSSVQIIPVNIVATVSDPEILVGTIESVAIEAIIKDNEIIYGEVYEY